MQSQGFKMNLQAGDTGDSCNFSMDSATQSDPVLPISEDSFLQSLLEKTDCPAALHLQKDVNQLPSWLEYASCMIHLSVFGILGVITRYLLQKLFGPEGIGATRDGSILYLDLPSNVIGSFFMGWIGVVFKPDIANVSDQLALGLSTGFLGSLTTFSSWNQKMLDLSVNGNWTFVFLGFLLGLFLVAYSIIFGIETAQGIQWLSQRIRRSSLPETRVSKHGFRVNILRCHTVVIIVLVSIWCTLWTLSATMFTKELHAHDAQLWLGCLVGPPGVWVRWWLARFNGRGLGQANLLSWLPFGTLAANVSAACMMAALATLKKVVNTEISVIVMSGIQLGFVGNLSTVSTMMAEFNSMRESNHTWRAYAYAFITIVVSFGLGVLIYTVPVWINGYN